MTVTVVWPSFVRPAASIPGAVDRPAPVSLTRTATPEPRRWRRGVRDGVAGSGHQIRRRAAGQDVGHALAGQLGHAGTRADGGAADMGQEGGAGGGQEAGIDLRLALEDVEPGTENGAAFEGIDQCVLIEHG